METVRVFHSNGNNTGYDLQDISIFTVLGGTMKYILETTKETYQVPLNTTEFGMMILFSYFRIVTEGPGSSLKLTQ